jgi:hypothetical protein
MQKPAGFPWKFRENRKTDVPEGVCLYTVNLMDLLSKYITVYRG